MKPRVLVLDDEPAVGRAVKRVLTSAGFEVDAVNDVASAREKLRENPFAVVISDERMPETSGVEFLASCAKEFPSMVRMLLTGFADPQTAAQAINRAEIFRLIFKPWSEEDFVSAVREAAWRYSLLGDEIPPSGGIPQKAEPVEPA